MSSSGSTGQAAHGEEAKLLKRLASEMKKKKVIEKKPIDENYTEVMAASDEIVLSGHVSLIV